MMNGLNFRFVPTLLQSSSTRILYQLNDDVLHWQIGNFHVRVGQ